MRKIIDVLALTSFAVSAAIVGGGIYAYNQKDAIIEKVKSQVMESVTEALPSLVAGNLTKDLPIPDYGTHESADSPISAAPVPALPVQPSSFFKVSETAQETKEERKARRVKAGLGDNVTISAVDGNRHLL